MNPRPPGFVRGPSRPYSRVQLRGPVEQPTPRCPTTHSPMNAGPGPPALERVPAPLDQQDVADGEQDEQVEQEGGAAISVLRRGRGVRHVPWPAGSRGERPDAAYPRWRPLLRRLAHVGAELLGLDLPQERLVWRRAALRRVRAGAAGSRSSPSGRPPLGPGGRASEPPTPTPPILCPSSPRQPSGTAAHAAGAHSGAPAFRLTAARALLAPGTRVTGDAQADGVPGTASSSTGSRKGGMSRERIRAASVTRAPSQKTQE